MMNVSGVAISFWAMQEGDRLASAAELGQRLDPQAPDLAETGLVVLHVASVASRILSASSAFFISVWM